jgi:FkbM family methyltransferase
MGRSTAALIENALCRTRLYRPARNTYQRIANRGYYAERVEARQFLKPFIPAGSIAFDIGANHGLMSERFLELGAGTVIAAEPIPALAGIIRRRYPQVTVVEAAVGADTGEAVLHVGHDAMHSTVSSNWAEHEADRFAGEITVRVVTLAGLMAEHGTPAFIKIDVEGYEDQVLATLDRPVSGLSFEYQTLDLDVTRRCLDALRTQGEYEFAAANGETMAFAHPWGNEVSLLEHLESRGASQADAHGDVYARLRD